MSSSQDTVGVATIDVNTTSQVTATHRVKTMASFAIWIVRNLTDVDVTVCLTNFTPLAGAPPLPPEYVRSILDDELCTKVLHSGHQGSIVGHFSGVPGSIYNYTIRVNSSPVSDPQLEI